MNTILIVDDEESVRRFLFKFLSQLGYKLITCNGGHQALGVLLEDETIDLVLTDYMMPEMDGIQLIQEIRSQGRIAHLPIVMMSGYLGEESGQDVMEKGASALLFKPLKLNELRETLQNALSSSVHSKIDVSVDSSAEVQSTLGM